jgi:hypothetical protein
LSEICAKAQNEKIAGGRPEIADVLHLFRKADARRTQVNESKTYPAYSSRHVLKLQTKKEKHGGWMIEEWRHPIPI